MRFTQSPLRYHCACFIKRLVSLVAVVGLVGSAAHATVYNLYPPDLNPILTLAPGDTAILHAGTYNRVYTAGWKGGSAADGWITIKGADGEARPKILYTGGNNVFEMPSVSYMKFQYLEIQGGADTFKFAGTCHDIVIDDVYMHDAYDGIVNASNIYEMYNLTVRNCEMSGTTLVPYGETFYLGKHDNLSQPQVHDSLIEHNYIHDVVEGVEIKAGCTNITVRDNVIAANRTGSAPSITIYGTYKTDNNLRYRIYRNFIYGSIDAGIQCTGDAEITNNIIVNSPGRGISIRKRNLSPQLLQNITVANNTIYGATVAGLYISDGNIASNVIVANNAIYQTSLSATAFNAPVGIAGVTLANNRYYGSNSVSSPGLILSAAPASVFLNASTTLGQMNLYPLATSPLINTGITASYTPTNDYNYLNRPRDGAVDVGAYEYYYDTNPGWTPTAGPRSQLGAIGDANLDGYVNVVDLQMLVAGWNTTPIAAAWNSSVDFNNNKYVNVGDLQLLVSNWGRF